jgi:hypothetical protein
MIMQMGDLGNWRKEKRREKERDKRKEKALTQRAQRNAEFTEKRWEK